MPKIEKRGNLYRVRVSTGKKLPNGSYEYVTLSDPDKKTLQHMLIEYQENRERVADDIRSGNITLRRALDDYLATCRAVGRAPSTIRAYASYLKNSYDDLLDKRLRLITKRDIQQMINKWSDDGASPKTVKNKLSFLTASMAHANVEPPVKKLVRPTIVERDLEIPEDDDVQRAIFYTREKDEELFSAILLGSTLGLRRGEICAIDLEEDIDYALCTITINHVLSHGEDGAWHVKEFPKTKSGHRVLIMPPLVRDAILSLSRHSGPLITCSPNAITERYSRLREKLNLPGTFHDLRHYKASVMEALGVPSKYQQKIIGHATKSMLDRVYQHTLRKKKNAVDDLLSAHSDAILSGHEYDYTKNQAAAPKRRVYRKLKRVGL